MPRPLLLLLAVLIAIPLGAASASTLPCYGTEVGVTGEVTTVRLCPPV